VAWLLLQSGTLWLSGGSMIAMFGPLALIAGALALVSKAASNMCGQRTIRTGPRTISRQSAGMSLPSHASPLSLGAARTSWDPPFSALLSQGYLADRC
jgi:hypothetical protein